jgi:hypothetical protein
MSFQPTFSHTKSRQINNGVVQKVPLPSNPASNQTAKYHSASHIALTPIGFGTLAYTTVLPVGAIIKEFRVLLTTAFSAGSAFTAGSTVAGTDLLGSSVLTVQNQFIPASAQVLTSGDSQTVFYTITGSPTVGAGFLLLEYFNPPVTINGLVD